MGHLYNNGATDYKIVLPELSSKIEDYAAEAMGYTPSAFSHTVTAVETELGVKIFNRGFNGITLTEEGKICSPRLKTRCGG